MPESMIVFGSESEAREAYFQADGEAFREDEATHGEGWAEPEEIDLLDGNWSLLRQERLEGDRSRYFVIGGPNPDTIEAMSSGSGTEPITQDDTFDDLPAFDTEDAAREAHAAWLAEHGEDLPDDDQETDPDENEETTDSEGNRWSEWEIVDEAAPWFVFGRFIIEPADAEGEEYLIAGEGSGGGEVYLAPNAEIVDAPYIYESTGDVEAALVAYFEAVDAGEIPEEDQPTGGQPNDNAVARAAGPSGRGSGQVGQRPTDAAGALGAVGRLIGTVARNPVLLVAVVGAGYLIWQRHGDEIMETLEVNHGTA